jgi:NAD(P)H-nitrite reductase large subunit
MELDDDLCICFHVSKRKVINFLRVERPRRAGQLSECFGAGTGCGWCRPFLRELFEQAAAGGVVSASLPSPQDYSAMRARYLQEKAPEGRDGSCPEASEDQSSQGGHGK